MAASETQSSCCSCTRHRIGITADACRPGGNFAICCLAQLRLSSLKVKLAGCSSLGAKRRTDILQVSLVGAARGARIQAVNAVFPERARGAQHVVADMRRYLDAVEDGKVGDGFEAFAARVIDDQLQRRLLQDEARHRMSAIVAVLLAENGGISLQQPGAALDGLDLHALDIKLDQVLSTRRNPAV